MQLLNNDVVTDSAVPLAKTRRSADEERDLNGVAVIREDLIKRTAKNIEIKVLSGEGRARVGRVGRRL